MNINKTKRAVLFHDMSCFGRCALSVIIPVISVLNVQPVIIPTALLSTHTGGFTGFTFLDLTEEIRKITEHYEELGVIPECIYTGFLGSIKQIEIISGYIEKQKSRGAYIFIDPVMGDDGRLYSSYTENMRKGMAELACMADIITPNITEAFFLLGMDYKSPPYSKDFINGMIYDLFELFDIKKIVITGTVFENGEYGVAYGEKNAEKNRNIMETGYIFTRRHEKDYPGSGDIFSSILCAKIMNGGELEGAILSAVEFIDKVMGYTIKENTPVREGLIFERFLPELI